MARTVSLHSNGTQINTHALTIGRCKKQCMRHVIAVATPQSLSNRPCAYTPSPKKNTRTNPIPVQAYTFSTPSCLVYACSSIPFSPSSLNKADPAKRKAVHLLCGLCWRNFLLRGATALLGFDCSSWNMK